MWRPLCFFSLVLFVGVTAFQQEARSESAQQVDAALDVLRQWLGEDNNGERWNNFLKTAALDKEIAKGTQADVAVLREILEVYAGDTPGLDQRRFVAVRRALAEWVYVLSLPPANELPQMIRSAKEDFSPIDTGRVQESRRALLASLEQLERFLATGGERKESGWKEYLRWDELTSELDREEGADWQAVERIQGQYFAEHNGLEFPTFVAVRRQLRAFGEALVFSDEQFQENFESTLDGLAESLVSYVSDASHANASLVGLRLGWLERSGQVPDTVRAVRHHYSKPNLYLQMSERLVGIGFEEDIEETMPIRDYVSGTSVSGRNRTSGKVRSQLVSNLEEGEIEVQFVGTSQSNTRGVN